MRDSYRFWWGKIRGRIYLEDLDVDGRIILKCIFKKCDEGHGLIDLAQDRDRWRTLVNAIINLHVP
jgi:hypothetical protein